MRPAVKAAIIVALFVGFLAVTHVIGIILNPPPNITVTGVNYNVYVIGDGYKDQPVGGLNVQTDSMLKRGGTVYLTLTVQNNLFSQPIALAFGAEPPFSGVQWTPFVVNIPPGGSETYTIKLEVGPYSVECSNGNCSEVTNFAWRSYTGPITIDITVAVN
jgi:hypothetical protein